MLEQWIDDIAKKCAQISDGKGNQVRSYMLFEKDEFPETLSQFPCALTYPEDVIMATPDSGPNVDTWRGITEFHLVPGTKKSDFPYMLRFFSRIRAVFATNRDLGGKVQYCKLSIEGPSIEGPVVFEPNTEIANQGLIVHWTVRERSS